MRISTAARSNQKEEISRGKSTSLLMQENHQCCVCDPPTPEIACHIGVRQQCSTKADVILKRSNEKTRDVKNDEE